MRGRRFSAGDYEVDEEDDLDDDGSRIWSCCGRREHEQPRKDWYNGRFSRGDPRRREGVRDPPQQDCPPTYHEPVLGAAGLTGWRLYNNGGIAKWNWQVK
ncbi:hypothetical protein F5X97DRAFT_287239 [Nemania serpens]|nr:hypothetical protein F5X97DRAFT_287239 [Nemania serpens]